MAKPKYPSHSRRSNRSQAVPGDTACTRDPSIASVAPDKMTDLLSPDDRPGPGGLVTTMHSEDVPTLRSLIPRRLPSVKAAIMEVPFHVIQNLFYIMPPSTTYTELMEHAQLLAKLPEYFTRGTIEHYIPLSEVTDQFPDQLSLKEMDLFSRCPVNLRDKMSMVPFYNIVRYFAVEGRCTLDDVFEGTKLLTSLYQTEKEIERLRPLNSGLTSNSAILVESIPHLEALHKTLVMYMWITFRMELSFPNRALANEFKLRTEAALDECLERLPNTKIRMKTMSQSRKDALENVTEAEMALRGKIKWERKKTARPVLPAWTEIGVLEETPAAARSQS